MSLLVPTADVHYADILPSNNTNELCVIDELYDIQNTTGTISADDLFSPNFFAPVLSLPQNVTCNNCTKEAYNILLTEAPQAITSDENSTIAKQCGANFLGLPPAFTQLLSIIDSCLQMAKRPQPYHRLQRVVAFPSQVEMVMSYRDRSCSGIYLHPLLGLPFFWRCFCEGLHRCHSPQADAIE